MDYMSSLFVDSLGDEITKQDIIDALRDVGADKCKALFIHSDISFGKLAPGVKRGHFLTELADAIRIGTNGVDLLVPTFTYSFCNNEDFDVLLSRTSMGALNEYIRKQPGRYRTSDPLLSISVPEKLGKQFFKISNHSLGSGSALDIIHNMDDVKFLFLGIRMGYCFTYVHYVEKMLNVPYRFDMEFEGNIIEADGTKHFHKQFMHTACYGVKPADFYYFEDELEEKGLLKKQYLGDQSIACISEKDAYKAIKDKLEKNINYFLEQPFTETDLEHKYTKGLDGGRITHC